MTDDEKSAVQAWKNFHKPTKKFLAEKIFLDGMTCLKCGKGWYDGYTATMPRLTLPCRECGHQAPAQMRRGEFRAAVAARDSKSSED